ncbi:sensor domain-containing diguanylate cyclase [Enterobacter huaxiensis]|uniref:diguanylate cyclase n=1 Tax=Enterobacter huaxiensis TaxID=2494702 RepID=A0ABU6EYA1_9ENTR|nr:diguanylate cyclase [Enterobacter huaxiensis]MEB7544925.1 diguanylate cyclase [Enterobacter huaxiensis]MEB7583176.1 diguanylate cyclase [Enterobacter huaxiensis]MEB7665425.1 diguanylate cyclase [Enterobacter huaxiensis]
MIESLNFRRPLNICFAVLAATFVFVGLLIAHSQWTATQEVYKKQNRLYINNVASTLDKYLNGYENSVREMARIAADQHKFDVNHEGSLALRNWLIERLRIMPDGISIIHADNKGNLLRIPYVEGNSSWDPRKEPWFTISIEDSDEAHFSISRDPFANKERVITISLPVINGTDGSNNGVLALNLDIDKSIDILNNALPPMKSRTFVMTRDGELVMNPGYPIEPAKLKALARSAREYRGDFSMDSRYYAYRAIASQSWLVVHEVDESELNSLVWSQCINIFWGVLFTLVVLFFCWWATRASMNTIFMRIATSIRRGAIKPAAVEELIFDEIYSSQQRHEKITHEALTDGLTGLKNRRAFDVDALRYNSEPQTHLAMIDIDNFKTINDTWGHTVGDVVLKTIAELGLRLRGLQNITLYRYGGEEIAVLFNGISQEKAQSYLEKWRITVNTRNFRENNLKVSFSAGLSAMGGASLPEVIARADKLLYQAKNTGKNKVIAG